MSPIELRARREALGLGQGPLAVVLGVSQATVSGWEKGRTMIPAGAVEGLGRLEDRAAGIVDGVLAEIDRMTDAGLVPVLFAFGDDESFWAEHPSMAGVPAVVHRVALARALNASEVAVSIAEAPVSAAAGVRLS